MTQQYKEIQPPQKKGFFRPWETTIEVSTVQARPLRVTVRSIFKKPLQDSLTRIAGIAHKTIVAEDSATFAGSETRRTGFFVSYRITPASE